MLKTINIQIEGIHCKSCKTLIETEVDVLEGVKDIDVNYQTGECQIEFDDSKISQKKIFEAIEKLNYKVAEKTDKSKPAKKQIAKKFIIAGILLVLFVLGYSLIKYFGLLEILAKLNEQNISYWLIFLIGVLVSFHCIGMCGGLVVTYTAHYHTKEKSLAAGRQKKTNISSPHLQYNAGRMLSYALLCSCWWDFRGSWFIFCY